MNSHTDVEYLQYLWPMRHYLVTSSDGAGRQDIIAVSFCMPVSKDPPLVACAIGRTAFSRELIEAGKEFVVNVPGRELAKEISYCGGHSGRVADKFRVTGLTPGKARAVRAPLIEECAAFMECKVLQKVDAGDKVLFLAEVVEAYADADVAAGTRAVEWAEGDFPAKVYAIRQETQVSR